jgi:hypothetical protein
MVKYRLFLEGKFILALDRLLYSGCNPDAITSGTVYDDEDLTILKSFHRPCILIRR